jgi:hypothetical protein
MTLTPLTDGILIEWETGGRLGAYCSPISRAGTWEALGQETS